MALATSTASFASFLSRRRAVAAVTAEVWLVQGRASREDKSIGETTTSCSVCSISVESITSKRRRTERKRAEHLFDCIVRTGTAEPKQREEYSRREGAPRGKNRVLQLKVVFQNLKLFSNAIMLGLTSSDIEACAPAPADARSTNSARDRLRLERLLLPVRVEHIMNRFCDDSICLRDEIFAALIAGGY